MSQALRWQTLAPRLLFVVVLLLAAQCGLGVAVRSKAMRTGEAAIGARVEVAHARVSFVERQIVLSDLQLANPRRPAENLLTADRCELDFATRPLLHKQTVVESGRISGLRFTTQRDGESNTAGTTSQTPPAKAWFRDDAGQVANKWFAHLAERFQPDVVEQFDSVKRTEKFCSNWEAQSAALDARGKELERRASELQQEFAAAQANPLRSDRFLDDLPTQVAELQKEFADLRVELEKLPDQLEAERRAIVAARRSDEALARKRLDLEGIEPNAFTAYLLRAEAAKPLSELLAWLRWVREAAPSGATPQATCSRGEDILFAGCRPTPSLLIKSLQLQGMARLGGQPVELRGLLSNASTAPSLHDKPMRLRLRTSGSLPLELQATIDRTGRVPRDELIVDCQGVILPQLALGRADQVKLSVAPSLGTLSVSLLVEGDKLTGDIQLVQQNVRITPTVGRDFNNVRLAGALGDSLGRINSLATSVSIGGTLSEPTCTLWSNLGPAVAEAMKQALERVGGQHTRLLLADAGKRVDEQLADMERQMTEQQARLTTTIAGATTRLQDVAAAEAPRYRISNERLGRRLPNNSLLR